MDHRTVTVKNSPSKFRNRELGAPEISNDIFIVLIDETLSKIDGEF